MTCEWVNGWNGLEERGPWHRDCILADRIVRRRAQTVRKTLEIIQLRNHRWLAKDPNNISYETVKWPFPISANWFG